jgi:hypothetical protein
MTPDYNAHFMYHPYTYAYLNFAHYISIQKCQQLILPKYKFDGTDLGKGGEWISSWRPGLNVLNVLYCYLNSLLLQHILKKTNILSCCTIEFSPLMPWAQGAVRCRMPSCHNVGGPTGVLEHLPV